MMGMCGPSIWCILGYLAVTCSANHVTRTLMFLNSGSTNNFDATWNTAGAINDPNGNKSLYDTYQLLETDSTDFKADIDPYLGNIFELELIGFNALGDELCHLSFDVTGINISHVENWFDSSNLLHTSITALDPKTISTTVRDGNKELLILTNSNEAWFSILHPSTTPGPDSRILLAVNSSAALTVHSTVDNMVEEGCRPDWELSLILSFTDGNSLTVQSCVQSCSTPYVALQSGENCFCGEVLTNINTLAYMCTLDCPGDAAFLCGGINQGYFSVYSATTTPSELDTLPATPDSIELQSFYHTSEYNYTINITAELLAQGWAEEYIYIDRISVNATNSTGHVMLYSFEYSFDMGITFREYDDNGNPGAYVIHVKEHDIRSHYILNRAYYINLSNSFNIFDVIMTTHAISFMYQLAGEKQHQLLFKQFIDGSYVSVPLIAILAHLAFDNVTTTQSVTTTTEGTTTTTEAITTSPTTTTDSGPSSNTTSYLSTITSLYNVHPNLSVSINGTLYCPCNLTKNETNTPNLTSIYQNSNKTFEELIADLTLDADTLSSNTKKFKSASDSRPSAATLGTLGIIIIVSTVSFVVYLDSARLIKEATKIKKTYKILKKRISKISLRIDSIDIQYKENDPKLPDVVT